MATFKLKLSKISVSILFCLALAAVVAVATFRLNIFNRTWTSANSLNKPRSEASVLSFEGDLYVFNGFGPEIKIENSIEKLDAKTGKWSLIATTSVKDGTAVTHNGLVNVGTTAWLIGGRIGDHPGPVTDQVWIFDLLEHSWTPGPRLPQPGGGGGAALVNNKIHWFGGIDSEANCDVDSHFIYDLENTSAGWRDISNEAPMPVPRNHFSTVVLDERIYAIGGQFGHDRCPNKPAVDTNLVHVFDTTTQSWSRVANLPFVQSHNEAGTFAFGQFIYSVGGEIDGSRVMRYDPLANKWQTLMELPANLLGTVARIRNRRLLIAAGGAPNTWNPTRKSFQAALPFPRSKPEDLCAPLSKGESRLEANDWAITKLADQYESKSDSSTHKWTPSSESGISTPHSLTAEPDIGTLATEIANSPKLSYSIRFSHPGTYYLWIHGFGDADNLGEGKNDSVHAGLDGALFSSGKAISGFPATGGTWSNLNREGKRVSFHVDEAGERTLDIWMREDGFKFDRFTISNNPKFNPTIGLPDQANLNVEDRVTGTTTTLSGARHDSNSWKLVQTNQHAYMDARHEAGAVVVDNSIYVLGGRQGEKVQAYNIKSGQWTTLGSPPIELHHFQPVALGKNIYVAGAFTGYFPDEKPVEHIYRFNTETAEWFEESSIPANRLRGSTGAVVHNGLIYLLGGNQNGHRGPAVPWFDVYDPVTKSWSILEDAPHSRDHASAAKIQNKLIFTSGRQSQLPNFAANTVSETDIYDFTTRTWKTAENAIPTERAGAMIVTMEDNVIVIGGESANKILSHAEVESFNVQTEAWSTLPSLIVGRHSGVAVTVDKTIHVISGNAARGGQREIACHEVMNVE